MRHPLRFNTYFASSTTRFRLTLPSCAYFTWLRAATANNQTDCRYLKSLSIREAKNNNDQNPTWRNTDAFDVRPRHSRNLKCLLISNGHPGVTLMLPPLRHPWHLSHTQIHIRVVTELPDRRSFASRIGRIPNTSNIKLNNKL